MTRRARIVFASLALLAVSLVLALLALGIVAVLIRVGDSM